MCTPIRIEILYMADDIILFDRKAVRQHRRRAALSNGVNDFLSTEISNRLIDRLQDVRRTFDVALDMGSTSPHTSPMVETRDAAALLQRAGFTIPVVDTDTLTVTYDNIFGLMHDLRSMGETNSVVTRNRYFLRRETVFTAEKCYRTLYGTKNGKIPATFQIIWLTGWAPHESQQKAIPRGSATKSLAKTLGTNKYPTG